MLAFLLALVATSAAPFTTVSGGDTTFVYGGCTQQKYPPSSSYQFSLNSLLTTLVNAAGYNIYSNFTVTAASSPTAYGLFQCRGDMASAACSACVSAAVSQLMGVLCSDSYGAAIQLEGCLRCGPGEYGDRVGPGEPVLEYLAGQPGFFRVGSAGDEKGVAQCVGDLSVGECQDCLGDAIGRLRSECGGAWWGDVYLVKCYARFSGNSGHARTSGSGGLGTNDTNSNDDEIQKYMAIIVVIIIGVALIVICFSFISRYLEKKSKLKNRNDIHLIVNF
uniref:Gnk2-homologous domain-containing protein n=1 Tax=Kalanchoe fedtschenkoi TaxID=63787 RepID=A0A7N0VM24_KALFE